VTTRYQNKLLVPFTLVVCAAAFQPVQAQSIYDNRGIITQGQTGNNLLTPPGGTVIQNNNGGIGADISVTGSQTGAPTVGLDTNGLTVIQNGPGIGMRVIVNGGNGPTTGVRSIVTPGGQ
jgi:hypothetical protein